MKDMKKSGAKYQLSAIEKLRRVASGIVFEENIKTKPSRLSEAEFKKMAEEVGKTFPDDYFVRLQLGL